MSSVIVNGSQRMMLYWEQFAPINACHVLELGENCPVTWEQFQTLAPQILQTLGIGEVCADARSSQYEVHPTTSVCEVERVPCDGEFDRCLEESIEREFLRPFSARSCPIRWLWVEETANAMGGTPRRAILATYRHAIADSVSIRLVCRQLIAACCGRPIRGPLPVYSELLWNDLRHGPQPPRYLGLLRYVAAEQMGLARSVYPQVRNSSRNDCSLVRFHSDRVPVTQIQKSAKSLGVSVQSLLFAAMFEALLQEPSCQMPSWRRSHITLQCPVDLRRFLNSSVQSQFGMMLGVYLVRIPLSGPLTFREIVADTHRQMERQKKRNSAGYYPWAMALLSYVRRWFPKRSGVSLPIIGGLSNANLNDEFREEFEAGELVRYSRATQMGDVLPMILAITSFGDEVSFLSTRHETFLDDESLVRIVSHVARRCRDGAG